MVGQESPPLKKKKRERGTGEEKGSKERKRGKKRMGQRNSILDPFGKNWGGRKSWGKPKSGKGKKKRTVKAVKIRT